MARIAGEPTHWRLLGGGGLIVGGLLPFVAVLVWVAAPARSGAVAAWMTVLADLVVGAALIALAVGRRGDDGVVGRSVAGRVALVVFGVGWIVDALLVPVSALTGSSAPWMNAVVAVLLVAGAIGSVIAVARAGIARGAARWVLAAPAALTVVHACHLLGWIAPGLAFAALLAASFVVAGLVLLLNGGSVSGGSVSGGSVSGGSVTGGSVDGGSSARAS